MAEDGRGVSPTRRYRVTGRVARRTRCGICGHSAHGSGECGVPTSTTTEARAQGGQHHCNCYGHPSAGKVAKCDKWSVRLYEVDRAYLARRRNDGVRIDELVAFVETYRRRPIEDVLADCIFRSERTRPTKSGKRGRPVLHPELKTTQCKLFLPRALRLRIERFTSRKLRRRAPTCASVVALIVVA